VRHFLQYNFLFILHRETRLEESESVELVRALEEKLNLKAKGER